MRTKLPEGSSYIAVKLSPRTLQRLDKFALNTFTRFRADAARQLIEAGLQRKAK